MDRLCENCGYFVCDGEGEDAAWMVWDTAAGKAVPNTTEGVTAALSGTFEVNGETPPMKQSTIGETNK